MRSVYLGLAISSLLVSQTKLSVAVNLPFFELNQIVALLIFIAIVIEYLMVRRPWSVPWDVWKIVLLAVLLLGSLLLSTLVANLGWAKVLPRENLGRVAYVLRNFLVGSLFFLGLSLSRFTTRDKRTLLNTFLTLSALTILANWALVRFNLVGTRLFRLLFDLGDWLLPPKLGNPGGLANPNTYAVLIAMILVGLVGRSLVGGYPRRTRLACLLLGASLVPPLWNTGSKGGVIIGMLGILAAIVLGSVARRKGALRMTLGVATLVVSLGVLTLLALGLPDWKYAHNVPSPQAPPPLISSIAALVGGERLVLAKTAFSIFNMNPFLGMGLGSFESLMPRFTDVDPTESPHSDFLKMLCEGGAIGFFLFVLLLWTIGKLAMRNLLRAKTGRDASDRLVIMAMLVTFVAAECLFSYLFRERLSLSFWFLSFLVVSGSPSPKPSPGSSKAVPQTGGVHDSQGR
jgi:O-antigen ligase